MAGSGVQLGVGGRNCGGMFWFGENEGRRWTEMKGCHCFFRCKDNEKFLLLFFLAFGRCVVSDRIRYFLFFLFPH